MYDMIFFLRKQIQGISFIIIVGMHWEIESKVMREVEIKLSLQERRRYHLLVA
jgi:hypothetical protein